MPLKTVVEQLETRLSSRIMSISAVQGTDLAQSDRGAHRTHQGLDQNSGRGFDQWVTIVAKKGPDQIMGADLILPSLDARDCETSIAVNRPHVDLKFDTMVQGLIDLHREFNGIYWSIEDIAHGLGMHRNEVLKHINRVTSQGQIQAKHTKNRTYYPKRGEKK